MVMLISSRKKRDIQLISSFSIPFLRGIFPATFLLNNFRNGGVPGILQKRADRKRWLADAERGQGGAMDRAGDV